MSSTALPSRQRPLQEREQLDLFRALPGDMAPRDSQDLMAFPFFSLAKSRRVAPIDFRAGNVTIRVEGTQEHGIATIWDADVLIWAASQIVEARDAGLRPSRLMQATPYEILRFIGRGTSLRDYQRLKAALDRLQSTTVATSIRETTGRLAIRFPTPVSEIGQRHALLGLRLRPARARRAAVAARLCPGHRADAGQRGRAADLPARAAHGTGITPGEPVDGIVLSGVRGIVLSGVRLSCYQEYESPANPITARVCGPSNFPNLNSLTFSRETPLRWTTTTRPPTADKTSHQLAGFAGRSTPGFPSREARP